MDGAMGRKTGKKGLMPLWATSILGVLFLILGAYVAITFYPGLAAWGGVILAIIGLVMILVALILT